MEIRRQLAFGTWVPGSSGLVTSDCLLSHLSRLFCFDVGFSSAGELHPFTLFYSLPFASHHWPYTPDRYTDSWCRTWIYKICTLFKIYLLLILCIWVFCLLVCLCASGMQCPQRPGWNVGSPGTGVTDRCELLFWYWALNLDTVLLTPECLSSSNFFVC